MLACGDTDDAVRDVETIVSGMTEAPVLGVRTKGDIGGSALPLVTSAATGEGLDALLKTVAGAVEARIGALRLDAPVLTRARHRYGVTTALDEVREFARATGTGNGAGLPMSVAAVHLRAAAAALADITGAIDVEDVLDRLFGTFCVGK